MSRSPQRRRRVENRKPIEVDAPVRISRTDGEDQLGVVESILTVQGHQNVLVLTETGEVVTMGERVHVVDGVDAKQAQQKAERGDND